ncbi:MoaD/ThiS family protein [Alkalibacter mobilis]|uniref:MoaD/ThiS family protein n=1 Tax=Alkalibacter mobilis TaxID=2787712 RepID=UPI00189DB7D0|nr:MoaD/ThiS family protein [Alkalibacter mobilis]MBF7096964.1 MoaD/ThiS family protein [Alkalibacter mobilis]
MKYTVKLFATLRENRGKILEMEKSGKTSIREITEELGIKADDVAILLLNGRDAKLDDYPSDGDTISIFPPVGGG